MEPKNLNNNNDHRGSGNVFYCEPKILTESLICKLLQEEDQEGLRDLFVSFLKLQAKSGTEGVTRDETLRVGYKRNFNGQSEMVL